MIVECIAFPTFAGGGTATGKVTVTAANNQGVVHLDVANQTTRALCATRDGFRIDTTSTPDGRGYFAVALTAASQGLPVTVVDSNTCSTTNSTYETVGQITMQSK